MHSFKREALIALQFLTRIPVRLDQPPTETEIGRSILYYPLIGLLLGGILAMLGYLLMPGIAIVVAPILLIVWVALTGALHLDGVADSADGWLGGHGDRDRTLKIMRDSRSGAAAIVAVLLLLIGKFAALTILHVNGEWLGILLATVLGRSAVLALVLTTPYIPQSQLGADLAAACPRREAKIVSALALSGCLIFGGLWFGWSGVVAVLVAAGGFVAARWLMLHRLGGATGDTTGATVEWIELLVLLSLAF